MPAFSMLRASALLAELAAAGRQITTHPITQGEAAVPELLSNPGSLGETIKLIIKTPTTALPHTPARQPHSTQEKEESERTVEEQNTSENALDSLRDVPARVLGFPSSESDDFGPEEAEGGLEEDWVHGRVSARGGREEKREGTNQSRRTRIVRASLGSRSAAGTALRSSLFHPLSARAKVREEGRKEGRGTNSGIRWGIRRGRWLGLRRL